MRGLDGKVSVIAGAAPGNIGAATALRLSAEGARVVVADLHLAAAEAVADTIQSAGGEAMPVRVNIADEASFAALLRSAAERFGGIDHLFNVAADLSPDTIGADSTNDITTLSVAAWQRTIDVTLTGYMYGTRHALPLMRARGGGSIVNTMSAAVWMAEPIRAAYSAAKAGIAALTRHTARIAGKQGVRCNAVAPGTVLTASLLRTLPDAERTRQLAEIASPRLGLPEDVAAAVAFLFSDDGAWVNGQVISVDGGLTMRG